MMTVNQGEMHDFLGMKLDCSKKGMGQVDMSECIVKMSSECGNDLGDHLHLDIFKVKDDATELANKKTSVSNCASKRVICV